MKQKNLSTYDLRAQDWRNGAVIYQVLVDRFAPTKDINQKKDLYQKPKILKTWDDKPKPGKFLEDAKYWSHELEYWGGDLDSLLSKISYFKNLNVDVLYLNPIFESLSNHKYDASDYLKISKEYGNFEDLKNLTDACHKLGMKVMLDGVFNHVGVENELFQKALNGDKTYKDWFDFDDKYPEGVRLWADAKSLPELNLENDVVKNYIYKNENSVLKTYLNLGIDGWRLDVAFDLGYQILKDLTEEAHKTKEGSMIVGEIWNYPEKWLKSIDGVMNFTLREIIYRSINQELSSKIAIKMIKKMIEDAGIESILKSWNVLDNHDVRRLYSQLSLKQDIKIAQVMQFMLPGSPNLYYGTELGMTGIEDPENRAPMRWDLLKDDNLSYQWTKKLIQLHHQHRALKIGDFRCIISEKLFAFERYTDKVEDTVLIIINQTDEVVEESMLVTNSDLMNYTGFEVILGDAISSQFLAGFLRIKLDKKAFIVLKPDIKVEKSYTPYKRIIGV